MGWEEGDEKLCFEIFEVGFLGLEFEVIGVLASGPWELRSSSNGIVFEGAITFSPGRVESLTSRNWG